MSSMFRKKRSSSSLHRQKSPQPPTPSAHTAATQAFLKTQPDEGNLSNAAAAAALRSYTPTPVGEVQTKRMMRRGSNSSLGSGTSSSRQPFSSDVQRRGSNGSMTQRTFRTPSPASRHATPPVPPLPADVPPLPNNGIPTVPSKSNQRHGSLDVAHRVVSPVSARQRPQSIEGSRWAPSKSPSSPQPSAVTRTQESTSPTSPPGSPRNINFSRPMSPPVGPTVSPNALTTARTSFNSPSAHPATSLGLSPEQYRRLEERREAARLQEEEWIERERKRNEAQAIARQNVANARPQTSSGPMSSASSPDTTPPRRARPRSSGGEKYLGLNGSIYAQDQTPPLPQSQSSGPLAKRTRPVSMPAAMSSASNQASARRQKTATVQPRNDVGNVKKEPQYKSPGLSSHQRSDGATNVIPSPTTEQIKSFQTRAASLLARPLTDNHENQSTAKLATNAQSSPSSKNQEPIKQHGRSVSSPVTTSQQSPVDFRGREPSSSPARSAHFSESPLLQVTKHAPPPRSVSPVKSALKGSSSRTVSPNVANHLVTSEQSDTASLWSDEGSIPSEKKKKSVRVSFEDKPVTVGEAAGSVNSPVDTIMSPQYKKQLREADTEGEHDFTMSPRPVLPSFGSIRGRKIRQADPADDEQMAAKTPDHAEAKPLKDAAVALKDDDEIEEPIPSEANISFNEDQPPTTLAAPDIAVLPATPRLEDNDQFDASPDSTQRPDVASNLEGALSAEEAPSTTESPPKAVVLEHEVSAVSEEPTVEVETADSPIQNSASIQQVEDDGSDTDEGGNDEFSDSVEDQSELEKPGSFPPLDAILESPNGEIVDPVESVVLGTAIVPQAADNGTSSTAIAMPTDEPMPASASASQEDWDSAKAYWSSLSEQQKLTMEQNHQPPSSTNNQSDEPQAKKPARSLSASKHSPTKTVGEKQSSTANKNMQKTAIPAKSSLRQSQPAQERNSSESTHLRQSMRHSGSMMSSMRGPPERSPSRGQQQKQRRNSAPQASAEAIALAQATAKSMSAKDAERKADNDAMEKEQQRGRALQKDYHYNMKRSMRDGDPSVRYSTTLTASSNRHSTESHYEGKSGGFLSFGKSKAKPSKPKKPTGGSGSRFKSRFADSSDEDSDEGGISSRLKFRSRFVDSDDSGDEGPGAPMPIKLTPVRGIPRQTGQEEGDSTELEDSEDERPPPRLSTEPIGRLPRSSKDRPGTPPTSQVLSFGKSPGPAGIDVSQKSRPTEKQDPSSPTSPRSPNANGHHANGSTAEGKKLAAGTLRNDESEKDKTKRHSLLSFGKKSTSAETKISGLSESKWAQTPNSPSTRPDTPSRGFAKTLRDSKDGKDKAKRHSMLRRLSMQSKDSATSTPASTPGGRPSKDEFPFPPPPIPEEYRSPTSPKDKKRPNTSDGISKSESKDSAAPTSPKTKQRPGLGDQRVSTVSTPGHVGSGERKAKQKPEPIVSTRTGKKKKFQGLRRAFGLND